MTTFLDLPRLVREKIYRLHFVREGSITYKDFKEDCTTVLVNEDRWSKKQVPHLLHVHGTIDKEAAPVYFGENRFDMHDTLDLRRFLLDLHIRHYRKIGSLTFRWDDSGYGASDNLRRLGRLTSLRQLRIHVDEKTWVRRQIRERPNLRWHESLGLSQQLSLLVLHRTGMNGLRDLREIPDVQFLKMEATAGDELDAGGAIDDGCLQTFIRREINGLDRKRKGKFRFLDLPGELRTRIYNVLLCWTGVVYPTNRIPTSVLAKASNISAEAKDDLPRPDSALALLAVSRAIHNEAVGIFYWNNDFVFSWPTELQCFIMSLSTERLSFVRNVTLFYKDHREGAMHTMDVTLSFLRRLPNLHKLHILLESGLVRTSYSPHSAHYRVNPGRIHGTRTLFTLRGIRDIKLRDLELEDLLRREAKVTFEIDRQDVGKKQAQVLRHFNHGLALAQQGTVVDGLFKEQRWHLPWHDDGAYPKLGDKVCSDEEGCSCPQ